nr:hypothetical protein CFP56_09167 [Quercus suber]
MEFPSSPTPLDGERNLRTAQHCLHALVSELAKSLASYHYFFGGFDSTAPSTELLTQADSIAAMCNGETGRDSQGGTIAIIMPLSTANRPHLQRQLSLRFAQDSYSTNASIDGIEACDGSEQVVIHRDGDLLAGDMSEGSILHLITVPVSSQTGALFRLPRRLDLSVGEQGVIGRRVSYVQGRNVLGQGIIGTVSLAQRECSGERGRLGRLAVRKPCCMKLKLSRVPYSSYARCHPTNDRIKCDLQQDGRAGCKHENDDLKFTADVECCVTARTYDSIFIDKNKV